MTNRQWLIEQMQNMSDEELADIVRCGALDKKYKMKCQGECCLNCKINWLKAEHKEAIKLSDAERVILEHLREDFVCVGKDERGDIYFQNKKRRILLRRYI